MRRYVLTGCAGFIGARTTETLLAAGNTVVGIDNLNEAYDRNLKERRLQSLLSSEGFRFHTCDISGRDVLDTIREIRDGGPVDGMIHMAACAGVRQSLKNPWSYYNTNVMGTLNMLESCHKHDIRKFVFTSTSTVYGKNSEVPFSEDADTDRLDSPYASSKKAAEDLCYTYHRLSGMDISVLRFFTGYGPAGRPDMSPFRFVQWLVEGVPLILYGDGSQSRDFTYVDDIVTGVVAALGLTGYETINLGSNRPVQLYDFISLLECVTKKKAELDIRPAHHVDMRITWANISKAKRILGWEPSFSLEEGVENLVDWYLENRSWASKIRTR